MGVHEFDQVRWLLGQEIAWVRPSPPAENTIPRPASDPDSATRLAA